MIGFSRAVRDLVQLTSNKKAERFANTSVTADELERLGKLLADIANLKKSEVVKPAPITVLPADGTASVRQPSVKSEQTALEACVDTVA